MGHAIKVHCIYSFIDLQYCKILKKRKCAPPLLNEGTVVSINVMQILISKIGKGAEPPFLFKYYTG